MSLSRPPSPIETFFRLIWRWHFWVGLLVAPILFITAITGAIYIFKDDLETTGRAQLSYCEPIAATVDFDAVVTAARAHNDNAKATRATVFAETNRTAIVQVPTPAGTQLVFVNPHTGVVQGTQPLLANSFFNIVLKLHRRVYSGSWGRAIVELVTSWSIVLTVSGIYLWWPRRWSTYRGVWLPRLRAHWYTVLRDLHTIPGVFLGLFIIIIAGTGLFFTQYWNQAYTAIVGPSGAFPRDFLSTPAIAPSSGARVSIQPLLNRAWDRWPGATLMVELGSKPTDAVSVIARRKDSDFLLGTMAMDPTTGEIVKETVAADTTFLAKVRLWVYPLHVGSIYGLPTKILALLVCLVIAFASLSGVLMWLIRKPKGRSGFPRLGRTESVPWPAVVTIVVLAMVLPTVLVTLVAALCVEGIWRVTSRRRSGGVPAQHRQKSDPPL